MNQLKLIEQTIDFVKGQLKNAEAGHDWFHIERVFNTAKLISKSENVDELVVELAALLHDIADPKFHAGDEELGPKIASDFLKTQKVDEEIILHVTNIIKHMSFKNSFEKGTDVFSSIEFNVVQDADRLDAMGAIGIARAFNYGGFKNRPLFDPKVAPNLNMTKEEYKNSNAPTINHFHEKLLLLKDKMNTETAKKLANNRHEYMLDFLQQFHKEWNGEQ